MFGPGSQIGKYALRRKLGQGGFGAVYAAYDESLDREVALKILNAEHKTSEDVMRRFLQEARLAAKIAHPGIVTVFECAEVLNTGTNKDGIAYIAMELLDGESLAHRLHRGGRMPVASAMEIARQLASALEAAHRNGIVHRDLKPDNIFLVKDTAVMHGERVKVLDFGIAKLHHLASGPHTQTNEVFGTPRYMSPEQCRSSTQIDRRSDIYTLGCILFELVTGRPPFIGQTGELFAQHLMVQAPSVLDFVRDTPYHVATLIARMLAKDVEQRPQTMQDVQRELEASGGVVNTGVPITEPPSVTGPLPPMPYGAMPQPDHETTLKGAAGVSMMSDTSRSRSMGFVVGAVGAIVAMVVAFLLVWWIRGDSKSSTTPSPSPSMVASTSSPSPSPSASPSSLASPSVTPLPSSPSPSPSPSASPSPSNPPASIPPIATSKSRHHHDDKSATDKAAVDKAAIDKAAIDKAAADKAAKAAADKATADKIAADKAAADKLAADKLAADKLAADKAAKAKKDDKTKIVNPFDTAATGTVSLRSNPSCEIFVDGKAIALSTPQDLKLAPGKHRITLVHDELDIKDAFNVDVKSGEVERINRDLRDKAKAKQRNATINPFGGG